MSQEEESIPHETQVMEVMRNLFSTEYGLDEEDRDLANRLVQYGSDKTGLSEKEIAVFIKMGIMDNEKDLLVPDQFFFRGLVLPSFWMKCLLAYHGMMDFSNKSENNEKTQTK
jgi:hypothetical protein